jgi:hypothetical protein
MAALTISGRPFTYRATVSKRPKADINVYFPELTKFLPGGTYGIVIKANLAKAKDAKPRILASSATL